MKSLSGKPKQCKNKACRKSFVPTRPFQAGCCPACDKALATIKRSSKIAQNRKQLDKAPKPVKPKTKKRGDHIADTQEAFNAWVRARDHHLPCVSCGNPNPPFIDGVQWDAGHFITRGAHPELRFHHDNAHKQCCVCNRGMGAPDVMARFELELLQRIGQKRLNELKGPHKPLKLTIAELNNLKAFYRSETRKLLKSIGTENE